MNHYPPRQDSSPAMAVAMLVVAAAMLLVLVLSMAEPEHRGVDPADQPLHAPAGLGL